MALAAYQLTQGPPATAIDIDKVANVGFVAENAGTISKQNLVRMGLIDIKEEELLAIVELAMMLQSKDVANRHLITGVHTSVDASSGEEELPFWSRDLVTSHLESLRPHLFTSTRSNAAESSS